MRAVPAPLLQFEYKGIAYVDILRAGVRFWGSEDKKMALGIAAIPRFGFKGSDGSRLTGMAERHLSVNLGPSFEWSTPIVDLNVAYVADVAGGSKGGELHALLFKQLADTTHWDIGVYTELERLDHRVANYYFGVRPEEATADRPFYQPGASTNWNLGLMGAYRINSRYALMFGVQNTRLGGAAAGSPIVETRSAKFGYVGLGWRL
jgi:outer membrane protein